MAKCKYYVEMVSLDKKYDHIILINFQDASCIGYDIFLIKRSIIKVHARHTKTSENILKLVFIFVKNIIKSKRLYKYKDTLICLKI